jgi:hypothetical protein
MLVCWFAGLLVCWFVGLLEFLLLHLWGIELSIALFIALLHHRHWCHEVLHLLLQRPQHQDYPIHLRLAELCEVRQGGHL